MNAIILAGGRSSRFGQNKAFANFGSQLLIERTVALLRQIFRKIYIVTNSPREYEDLEAEIVIDIFKNCGPLGGIHAGLLASDRQPNFVAACDMPFLNRDLIDYLIESLEGYNLIVPRFSGKLHPLFAVYTKDCLPQIEKQLEAGDLRLTNLIAAVNSKIVEEEEIRNFDYFGKSFVNVNTFQDLRKATIDSPHLSVGNPGALRAGIG